MVLLIGGKRTYIFVSGKFVRQEGDKKYVEFGRVNRFGLKLENAKLVRTGKRGTFSYKT